MRGGHIIIEIQDDGAGIKTEVVKNKAIERGLLTKEAAVNLSENQILRFIFEAGFSTASQVTEVSGRGVGMDVVRSNIEGIGGSVDISSQEGVGTTIRIKIPLTLAIISALLVKAGTGNGSVFAIPQVGVVELVHISESNSHLVDNIQGSKMLRLRGKLLPLVDLATVLGFESEQKASKSTSSNSEISLSVVVVQVSDMQFGLVVDEVYDTQEIVVKPVGRLLRDINLFSGSTILGDGRVVIILDISRVAAQALPKNLIGNNTDQKHGEKNKFSVSGDRTSLLIFRASTKEYFAVPLALVARLEEFDISKLEKVDDKYVVQYRGSLLPLIPSSELLDKNLVEGSPVTVIVFSDSTRSMGLWVHDFVDITEETLNIETTGTKPGHLGSAIIAGRATELIDSYYFLRLAYPQWFQTSGSTKSKGKSRILFVEDSTFFQNLLKPMLEAKGYDVIMAGDGSIALNVLKQDNAVDLILSDIEMPNIDGFEMISKIRENPETKHIPALALTTLADPPNKEPGHVWIAPGGSHLVLSKQGNIVKTALNQEPPENSCRPAVDVLFRSVNDIYGANTLAVIMTGMGSDGFKGCEKIHASGGQIIIQDEASSVVWGMPSFVAKAGIAQAILPLDKLAGEIIERSSYGRPLGSKSTATPNAIGLPQ